MPKSVHVKVRNWAIASNTFAVMSWSARTAIEVKASDTATANDVAEMVFSKRRFIVILGRTSR